MSLIEKAQAAGIERHIEGAALTTVLSAVMGYMPSLATCLAVAWYGVMFFDRFTKGKDKGKDEGQ